MGSLPHAWPGNDCPLTRAPQRHYGEDGTGVAGGKAFVEVGMVASGSGAVAVTESGELLVLADRSLVRGAVATDGVAWVVVSNVAVKGLGVSLAGCIRTITNPPTHWPRRSGPSVSISFLSFLFLGVIESNSCSRANAIWGRTLPCP